MRRSNSSEACDFCLDDETERGPLQLCRHALRRCDGLSVHGPSPSDARPSEFLQRRLNRGLRICGNCPQTYESVEKSDERQRLVFRRECASALFDLSSRLKLLQNRSILELSRRAELQCLLLSEMPYQPLQVLGCSCQIEPLSDVPQSSQSRLAQLNLLLKFGEQ